MNWSIWIEGWRTTESSGIANCLGIYEANSFEDAVKQLHELNPDTRIEYNENTKKYSIEGCRLHTNQYTAQMLYG